MVIYIEFKIFIEIMNKIRISVKLQSDQNQFYRFNDQKYVIEEGFFK
jgi:fructose-1-phosphate kinase PfkB-like protein